jgi:uncharacterized protein
MDISGECWLPAARDEVWRLLHDVDALRRCVPGCQALEQTGLDVFSGSANVGIGVIKGLYRGTLRLLEEQEPDFARVKVEARSGHAEIKGEGQFSLAESEGGTVLRYTGAAHISGPLAAVGQRLLPSATKTMTEAFFRSFEEVLVESSSDDVVKR